MTGANLVLLRKRMLGLGWVTQWYSLQIERIRHRLLERLVRGRGSRLVQSRGDRHCRLHLQVLWRGFGRCQIPRLRGSWTWLRVDGYTTANELIYIRARSLTVEIKIACVAYCRFVIDWPDFRVRLLFFCKYHQNALSYNSPCSIHGTR